MQIKKIIIIVSFWSTWSFAQPISEALKQCAMITSNNERLVCFDKLAKSHDHIKKFKQDLNKSNQITKSANTQTIEPLVTVKPQINKSPILEDKKTTKTLLANFGREHIKSKEVQEFDKVEFIIKSAKLSLRKQWRLTFQNGQVWHAAEVVKGLKFKKGDVVVIRRGVLNAFYIKKKGSKRSIRVKRIK